MVRRETFKIVWQKYINGELELALYQRLGIVFLVVVFSGLFGWLYEFVFYFFDAGTGRFYMQGGNFLPWINIYAIGALLILLTTRKLKRQPVLLAIVAMTVTGVLEYVAGFLIYELGGGTRYWNYNTEILNFGNINGFVCLRSVLFFGASALFLMYAIVPFCAYLARRMSRKAFLALSVSLFALVMVDEVYNLLASKCFDGYSAMDFYRGMGWEYWRKG